MGRTDRTINHAIFLRATSSRPEKLHKRVTFRFCGHVPACSNLDPGTVAGRRRSVLYEIYLNSEILIRHRNQLKHRNVENPIAPSMPWSVLLQNLDSLLRQNLEVLKPCKCNRNNYLKETKSSLKDCRVTRT